ncbi:MAG: hypothetical protein HYX54_01430 [Chloroflexi bacterium]|nr:hypothetical protein [Chloroflexota bacterium]
MRDTPTTEAWIGPSAGLLEDLGFTLFNSNQPSAAGGAQLLAALRAHPTLRHFDPETVTCWRAAAGRGRALTLDRRSSTANREILWGQIHVTDRFGIENRFLTFGGSLQVADASPEMRLVRHASPGPIVRWGGHSQGSDALAGEIGAFFGRLIIPIDYLPGGEERVTAEPAEHLYAAFLRDAEARRREAAGRHPTAHGGSAGGAPSDPWLRAEITRVRAARPAWWASAGRLLDDLNLGPDGFETERAEAWQAADMPAGSSDRSG